MKIKLIQILLFSSLVSFGQETAGYNKAEAPNDFSYVAGGNSSLFVYVMPTTSFGYKKNKRQLDLVEVTYVKNQDNSLDFNFTKKRTDNSSFISSKNFKFGTYLLIIYTPGVSTGFSKILRNNSGTIFRSGYNNNNFQWSYKYFRGNINSTIQPNFKYILPFKEGETVKPVDLSSVESVTFNSQLPKEWKSYSFSFDETQSVKAIRKGVVIDIENNFEIDTLKIVNYYSNHNSISVEHNDGTVANYKGFHKNKIIVKLGETVFPQTELGELAKFNSKSLYRLYLSLYYYKTINGKNLNNISTSDDYEILYLRPKFFQNGEAIELKNGNNYKVQFDEKTLYKEMRRKEIKKHKSNKL